MTDVKQLAGLNILATMKIPQKGAGKTQKAEIVFLGGLTGGSCEYQIGEAYTIKEGKMAGTTIMKNTSYFSSLQCAMNHWCEMKAVTEASDLRDLLHRIVKAQEEITKWLRIAD